MSVWRYRQPCVNALVGAGIALFFVLIVWPWLTSTYQRLRPAEDWLEVGAVIIEDARVGQAPLAYVDRTVKQSVLVRRLSTLFKEGPDGFYRYCSRAADLDFIEGQSLPPGPLTLDFWLDIPANPACPPLEAGRYVLSVSYTIQPESSPPKVVRKESNVFTISEERTGFEPTRRIAAWAP